MKALAVIPARATSTRLPNKNALTVQGLPLVVRAARVADAARALGVFEHVIVSYDTWYPALDLLPFGVYKDRRSEETRGVDFTTLQIVQDVLSDRDHDLVCLLLPSSPLRTLRHVVESRLLLTEGVQAVLSVTPFRQDPRYVLVESGERGPLRWVAVEADPPFLKHCGTVIWARSEWLRTAESWYDSDHLRAYHVPPEQSVDVNDALDLRIAEALLA